MSDHSIQPTLIFVKSPNCKLLILFQAFADRVTRPTFRNSSTEAMRT
jgi:hypothetical protein